MNPNVELWRACERGDLDRIPALLAAGADQNSADAGGTALHRAAKAGHAEIVRLLLGRGILIDETDERGFTALHRAAGAGHAEIVRMLLEAGANPHVAGRGGWTPLHTACADGCKDCAALLLERGADQMAENSEGMTPYDYAKRRGFDQELEGLCLPQGHRPEYSPAPVKRAIQAMRAGESESEQPHSHPQSAADRDLLFACRTGDYKAAAAALANGANPDASDGDYRPLHWAAQGGFTDVVLLLSRSGADPNARDRRGFTPLHKAVEGGYSEAAEVLLTNGADPNAQSATGWTPLHAVCANGDETGVDLLFRFKVKEKMADFEGLIPYDYARRAGNRNIALATKPRSVGVRIALIVGSILMTVFAMWSGGRTLLFEYQPLQKEPEYLLVPPGMMPILAPVFVGYAVALIAIFSRRMWIFTTMMVLIVSYDLLLLSFMWLIEFFGRLVEKNYG
ncbi:MAG: ankyrin repeat domain-containing protein [Verrucomicrobiales bacterium]